MWREQEDPEAGVEQSPTTQRRFQSTLKLSGTQTLCNRNGRKINGDGKLSLQTLEKQNEIQVDLFSNFNYCGLYTKSNVQLV